MTTARRTVNRPTRGQHSPLPPHGTAARGTGRPRYGITGCKCQPCRDAKNKADQMRLILNTSGRPVRIPAAPVAHHIRNLLTAGMGWPRIARAAHCSSCTIHRILSGQELIRRTVAERILAVKARPAPGRYVNALGTRRRIQALMAIGHTIVGIVREAGIDHSVINDILRGRATTVRGMTADRIAAAYDWLSVRPDTWSRKSATTTSRKRAAREGWAPPAAWDDIDDPDATPDTGNETRLGRDELAALRRDEIQHLASYGYSPEHIHQRLGEVALSTIQAIVREHHTGQRRQRTTAAA